LTNKPSTTDTATNNYSLKSVHIINSERCEVGPKQWSHFSEATHNSEHCWCRKQSLLCKENILNKCSEGASPNLFFSLRLFG